jgi:predicted DNA-binding antitoxin AbrB/MazE fold protein
VTAFAKGSLKNTEDLVGAGRFERPTTCAQGIEALAPLEAGTEFEFNEMACNRLQWRNLSVVDSVAGGFLGFQRPATRFGRVRVPVGSSAPLSSAYNKDMPLQVEAIYENGVLRPLQALDLSEQEHVMVSVVKVGPASGRSHFDAEYIDRIKRELPDAGATPGLEEVRRRLAKIPGSMAAEIVAERGER